MMLAELYSSTDDDVQYSWIFVNLTYHELPFSIAMTPIREEREKKTKNK